MTGPSRIELLGFDIRHATPEQIAAVESLTDEEMTLLVKIKRRFDESGADVEGHIAEAGGVVW